MLVTAKKRYSSFFYLCKKSVSVNDWCKINCVISFSALCSIFLYPVATSRSSVLFFEAFFSFCATSDNYVNMYMNMCITRNKILPELPRSLLKI